MGQASTSDFSSGKVTDLHIGHIAQPSETTAIFQQQANDLRFANPVRTAASSNREVLTGNTLTITPINDLAAPPSARVDAQQTSNFDKHVSVEDLAKAGKITDMSIAAVPASREALKPGETPTIKIQLSDLEGKTQTPPDFVIAKDGSVMMMNNPEKTGQKDIVIEVQRENGQLNPTDAQQKSVNDLYSYIDSRVKHEFPDATQHGVKVSDDQALVDRNAERQAHAQMPHSNPELPRRAQSQEGRMNRHRGGGKGTMPRSEADESFPEREVPRQPNENNQMAAMKDVVAGFTSRGDRHPYNHVEPRGGRGFGIGRYSQTFDQIANWLSNVDVDNLEKLEQEGKLPKGTAARMSKMKASVEKAHESGKDSDLDPFLQKMKAGDKHNPVTPGEINHNFGKEVQELSASDNIGRMAQQMGQETGKVDPGQLALGMMLGRVPSEQDMANPGNKRVSDAANQAFQIAENRQQPGDNVQYSDTSNLSQAMHDAVGKQLWRGFDGATEYGNKGCAITVSRILRAGGVPVKEELGVEGLKHEMERIGAQKVSLNQAIASGQKYVIIKQHGGSHTGIAEGRTVVENSSGQRKTVVHDISQSFLRSGSVAYIIPTRNDVSA